MSKVLTGFICAALGATVLTILAIGWTAVEVGHHVDFTLAKVDVTLNEVNRPCDPPDSIEPNPPKKGILLSAGTERFDSQKLVPCGTLADVNKTLATVRGTFGQIEVATRHENQNLATLDRQEAALFADLHSTAMAAQGTLNASTDTLNAMTGTLGEAQDTIKRAGPVLDSANTAIGQFTNTTAALTPRLESILDQAGPVMTNVQGMTANGNRILKDGADEADKLVHPPVKKLTFLGAIDGAMLWVHSHVIPPIF